MDIQHLVDRLEDLIGEGRRVPLSEMALINEKRALAIIDQMRSAVPEEVDRANRLLAQRDQILIKANEEAARVLDQARETAEKLIARDAIMQQAQDRAARLIEEARTEIEKIKGDADEYVGEVLTQLETQLLKPLAQVRNGLAKITADKEVQRQRAEAIRQGSVAQAASKAENKAESRAEPTAVPSSVPAVAATVAAPAGVNTPMRVPADPVSVDNKPGSKPVVKPASKLVPSADTTPPVQPPVQADRRPMPPVVSNQRPDPRVNRPVEVDVDAP